MTRLLLMLIWAVLAAAPAAAGGPWTGEWQLSWSNGGTVVDLAQDGNAVSGSFSSGRMQGTADERQFTGQIVYNGATEQLTATLSGDGQSFAGTTESGDWLNGTRLDPAAATPAAVKLNLANPRAALRSFLVSANRAQADKGYAMGAALDAIDFGGGPDWASREARFSGAQQLFQLIDRATFNLATVPDTAAGPTLGLSLPVADSNASVAIDMRRGSDGSWRIVMPGPERLRAELESGKPHTADGYRLLQSPRDTLRAFLEGMKHWDVGGAAQALDTIDLSQVPEVLRVAEGQVVAQYLVRILDQVGHHTLQNVPNSGVTRTPFIYFELPAGSITIEPVGTGDKTRWKFSAETAHGIRDLYRAAEQLPAKNVLGPDFIPYSPMFALRDGVKRYAPALLGPLPGPGRLEAWQLLASLAALAGMVIGTLILRRIFYWLLTRPSLKHHVAHPERLALALGLGIAFLTGARFVWMLGLPAATRQYTLPVVGTFLLLILGYALWQVVVFVLSLLQDFAERTDTAFDNILITFAAGVAKLAIVAAVVLGLSYLWSLPTSGLIAGLGVSGLAVAFASKETLSNVFGAGILLGDRPFRKGDRIIAGDVNGWVEAVGLRSTRIRTIHDSLLVVPNGKLADMSVNNLGARRRRALSTTFLVTFGATPQRMESFTEGVRKLLADNPIFDSRGAEVRISRITAEGIEIEISTMMETRSGRAARAATHQLYLDVLRLAEELGLRLGRGTELPAAPAAAPA